jgi:hypothetical protein
VEPPRELTEEDVVAAREMIVRLVGIAREMQDDARLAMALHAQGHSLLLAGELVESAQAFDESRELSVRLGDKRGAAITLSMLGFLALVAGELEEGLPRIVSAFADLEPDDPARARVALYLIEKKAAFDAKRFEAALKAATRAHGAEVHAAIVKALEAAGSTGH